MMLKEKVQSILNQHGLINYRWVLALSGGKDSMVLAHIFKELSIDFIVAHVNYGFRGVESDGDETFVREWCSSHKLTSEISKLDGKSDLENTGKNLQGWARDQRYAFFEKIRTKYNAQLIATAQHADDQIETVLLQLFRGAGLKGIAGMNFLSENLVRPLLYVTQSEIAVYAKEENIAWREDSTNAKADYRRNALRLNVIPALKEIFPHLSQNIMQSSEQFSSTDRFLQNVVAQKTKALVKSKDNKQFISIALLHKEAELHTLLHYLLQPFGFGAAKVVEVIKLLDARQGAFLLSEAYRIMKSGGNLVLEKNRYLLPSFWIEQSDLSRDLSIVLGSKSVSLVLEKMSLGAVQYNTNTQYLAADKLSWPLLLRSAQPGDYMYPMGINKKKKIAKILIDAKIPVEQRTDIWVLLSNQHIISIIGIKIDHRYKLEKSSELALKLII